jgi:AraC-like DNA-binding protein
MKNFSNYTDYDRKENLHFESKAVHGALGTEPLTGAVSMPIFQAVTYRHPALGESTGFAYSRLENPTRQELERTMAILEGGIKAFAFSSGQAANMAVFSLLNPGDHVLLSDDIYGGTFRIIGDVFGKYGIEHSYVEMDDLSSRFYLSRYYLMHTFKEQTGYSIGSYLSTKRLLLAKELILSGKPITDVCYECGFKNYSTFSRAYKKCFGESPRDLRQSTLIQ